MAKRGPTPSLIGGTHGTVDFHVTGKKSECRRCKEDMPKGTRCVRVTKPGRMGAGKPYCTVCFTEIASTKGTSRRRKDATRPTKIS